VVDNAANTETRKALMSVDPSENNEHSIKPGADPAKTVLGHMMQKLAVELGFAPGEFHFRILTFGLLRIELDVLPQ